MRLSIELEKELIASIENKDFESFREIVTRENIDVNSPMSDINLIHRAAAKGSLDILKYLVELGANISATTPDGSTAIHEAAKTNQVEVIRVLNEFGANIEVSNNFRQTPLFDAASSGSVETIKLLSALNCDIEATNDSLETPLFYAAHFGKIEAIRLLIELGANVNASMLVGMTPIFSAVTDQDNEEVVKALIEAGADINVKMQDGTTPIFFAAYDGRKKIVSLLAAEGADLEYLKENLAELSEDIYTEILPMAEEIYQKKLANQNDILDQIKSIRTGSLVANGKDSEDVDKLKEASEQGEDLVETLTKYKEKVLEKIESGELQVTIQFKREVIKNIDQLPNTPSPSFGNIEASALANGSLTNDQIIR